MKISNNSARIRWICALMVVVTLTACTRHVSRGIGPDAQAEEVIFPSTDKLVLKEGTFPNVDNLRQIGQGVTKSQIYDLIGRPHFREGFVAHEWDYLFHFREGDKTVTCQYKIIFDEHYHGQAFHWLPAACGDRLKTDASIAGHPKRP